MMDLDKIEFTELLRESQVAVKLLEELPERGIFRGALASVDVIRGGC